MSDAGGQTLRHDCKTPDDARAHERKLIREKLAKGYVEIVAFAPPKPIPPASIRIDTTGRRRERPTIDMTPIEPWSDE